MPYTYPQVPASQAEDTPAIPAIHYGNWVVTSIAHTLANIVDESGQLIPAGQITVTGQKMDPETGLISPGGEVTVFVVDDLEGFFNSSPEFAAGYNAFVEICMQGLEMVDATRTLQRMIEETFEDALRQIRAAYQRLDNDTQAAIATDAIQNYPATWTKRECLEALGLWLPQLEDGVLP